MTTATSALTELHDILGEVSDLNRAAAVLGWDQETHMPPGGVESRAQQLSTLRRLAHRRFTSDEVDRLLEEAAAETQGSAYDSNPASLVRVTRREYEQARKLDSELVSEITRASAMAQPAWVRARQESRWELFAPHLERNVELNRRVADALGYQTRPYDALLNRIEPGMTAAKLEDLFAQIKAVVVPLVAAIAASPGAPGPESHYEIGHDAQVAFAERIVQRLGYDMSRGRQDISTHPFCTSFGPGDVRITTRARTGRIWDCLYGSIHESGHAMYNQGIGVDLDRTPLWGGATSGVHESQSRLWENLIGRSRAFASFLAPELAAAFPEVYGEWDGERLYREINRVEPSLIRVEADELTYNLHIMLRFELENEMLEGRLAVADVPEAWRAKMRAYLGVVPEDDRTGCLQDIHWTGGSFAGFPSYALGNLIGAQLMEVVRRDLPDLDVAVAAGDFAPLLGWLRDRVHRVGRKFTPDELLERVTGRGLTAQPWIDYVSAKYGALYSLA